MTVAGLVSQEVTDAFEALDLVNDALQGLMETIPMLDEPYEGMCADLDKYNRRCEQVKEAAQRCAQVVTDYFTRERVVACEESDAQSSALAHTIFSAIKLLEQPLEFGSVSFGANQYVATARTLVEVMLPAYLALTS